MIELTGTTDPGRKRELNEDAFELLPNQNIAIVCDGMGGHAAGDVASKIAIETIVRTIVDEVDEALLYGAVSEPLLQKALPKEIKKLVLAVRLANRRIYNAMVQQPALRGMGTTLVAAHWDAERIYILHVGDSRLYRIRNRKIEQMTLDHSWVNELLQDKEITEEDAKNFKNKNIITRALGIDAAVKIDLTVDTVLAHDIYLLCTDGLNDVVEDETILHYYLEAGPTVSTAETRLIHLANAQGGPDNITIVTAKCDGAYPTRVQRMKKAITLDREHEAITESEDLFLRKMFGGTKILDAGHYTDKPGRKKWMYAAALAVAGLVLALGAVMGLMPHRLGLLPDEKQKVTLQLRTTPEKATIKVNGIVTSQTPDSLSQLPADEVMTIEMSLLGYEPLRLEKQTASELASILNSVQQLTPIAELNISYWQVDKWEGCQFYLLSRDSVKAVMKGSIRTGLALPEGEYVMEIRNEEEQTLLSRPITIKKNERYDWQLDDNVFHVIGKS